MATAAPTTGAPTRAPLEGCYEEFEQVGDMVEQVRHVLTAALETMAGGDPLEVSTVYIVEATLSLLKVTRERFNDAMVRLATLEAGQ